MVRELLLRRAAHLALTMVAAFLKSVCSGGLLFKIGKLGLNICYISIMNIIYLPSIGWSDLPIWVPWCVFAAHPVQLFTLATD